MTWLSHSNINNEQWKLILEVVFCFDRDVFPGNTNFLLAPLLTTTGDNERSNFFPSGGLVGVFGSMVSTYVDHWNI